MNDRMDIKDSESLIIDWLLADSMRMEALKLASSLNLPDWCLAAGFVRNLVWDKVHNKPVATPLNDLDLIYFDRTQKDPERDRELEKRLRHASTLPWSVKNQARMHLRNRDHAYCSTSDAMRYWVEVETAIGARLKGDTIELIAPLGLHWLFANTITLNGHRPKVSAFQERVKAKEWLRHWPNLQVMIPPGMDGNEGD